MAVFANGMEISSKSMGGKSICQFPDVCFTPPLTPATPPGVPIPYPNTGMASDTTDGSATVKIGGESIMLKDKSYFKSSTGDEAGSAPKKGLLNSKTKGKVFFVAWSMDVKVEGENVVRNLDMTTHNHASPANGALPTVHAASVAMGMIPSCAGDAEKIKSKCDDSKDAPPEKRQCPGALSVNVEKDQKEWVRVQKKGRGWKAKAAALSQETKDAMAHHAPNVRKDKSATVNAANMAAADANDCVKAMRCFLRPKSPNKDEAGCCPGQTPNHIPPDTFFTQKSYQYGAALCVCLEGMTQHAGTHAENHALIDYHAETLDLKDADGKSKGPLTKQRPAKLKDAIKVSTVATAEQTGCSEACLRDQLEKHFNDEQGLPVDSTNVKYQRIASKDRIDALKKREVLAKPRDR